LSQKKFGVKKIVKIFDLMACDDFMSKVYFLLSMVWLGSCVFGVFWLVEYFTSDLLCEGTSLPFFWCLFFCCREERKRKFFIKQKLLMFVTSFGPFDDLQAFSPVIYGAVPSVTETLFVGGSTHQFHFFRVNFRSTK
jgi:hypothetical protein